MPNKVALPGSDRKAVANAVAVGKPNPSDQMEVTVLLRPREGAQRRSADVVGAEMPGARKHMSREEFEATAGADPADIAKVEAYAHQHNLTVVSTDLARRTVVLAGTVADFTEAMALNLKTYQHTDGEFRGRTGPIYIPQEFEGMIQGIFGVDDRPQAKPRLCRFQAHATPKAAGDTSYNPPDIAKLYNFPANTDGSGQCIAIIELGGGYRASELKSYFAGIGLKSAPSVSAISVDHGRNHPTHDPNSADGEVVLDIEVAGSISPGAKLAVYFAPNTDRGFLDAITTAVHDKLRNPSVISISWGAAESQWTQQARDAMNQAFQDAAALGVTICAASGDDGSVDGVRDGQAHVDFPAASPYVLACGGTRLESANGQITNEVTWNHGAGHGATGGGVSEIFPRPAYQDGAGVPPSVNPSKFVGRGVPDVSGDADPATGYQITVDGSDAVFGGTSAVSPLWAALIARLNQQLGSPLGFINPLLYQTLAAKKVLNDITAGDNGAYSAKAGWDACTGLGTPDGTAILKALTSSVATAS